VPEVEETPTDIDDSQKIRKNFQKRQAPQPNKLRPCPSSNEPHRGSVVEYLGVGSGWTDAKIPSKALPARPLRLVRDDCLPGVFGPQAARSTHFPRLKNRQFLHFDEENSWHRVLIYDQLSRIPTFLV
jgi:hypothetical protein